MEHNSIYDTDVTSDFSECEKSSDTFYVDKAIIGNPENPSHKSALKVFGQSNFVNDAVFDRNIYVKDVYSNSAEISKLTSEQSIITELQTGVNIIESLLICSDYTFELSNYKKAFLLVDSTKSNVKIILSNNVPEGTVVNIKDISNLYDSTQSFDILVTSDVVIEHYHNNTMTASFGGTYILNSKGGLVSFMFVKGAWIIINQVIGASRSLMSRKVIFTNRNRKQF